MIERQLIEVSPDCRPILTVVIHTEEEFDWDKPHDRNATGVAHMRHIHRAQAVFDEFGIVPNYVVDYPIATKREAFEPLKAFADSGRALIGAHLHPWVSPPFDEEVNARNSFPGNLPRALEYEKLRVLTEQITTTFGTRPLTYLAGRYGFGPNTGEILEDAGLRGGHQPRRADRLQRGRRPQLFRLHEPSLLVREVAASPWIAWHRRLCGTTSRRRHAAIPQSDATNPAQAAHLRRSCETAIDGAHPSIAQRITANPRCAASRSR